MVEFFAFPLSMLTLIPGNIDVLVIQLHSILDNGNINRRVESKATRKNMSHLSNPGDALLRFNKHENVNARRQGGQQSHSLRNWESGNSPTSPMIFRRRMEDRLAIWSDNCLNPG
jgi:hypothetical protein